MNNGKKQEPFTLKDKIMTIVWALFFLGFFSLPFIGYFTTAGDPQRRQACVIGMIIVGVIITIAVIGSVLHVFTVRRATAETNGVIVRVRRNLDEDGAPGPGRYWVKYTIDRKVYEKKFVTRIMEEKDLEKLVGKRINIFCDPKNPQRSYTDME